MDSMCVCEPALAPGLIIHCPYDTKWPVGNSEAFNILQPRNKNRFVRLALCCWSVYKGLVVLTLREAAKLNWRQKL